MQNIKRMIAIILCVVMIGSVLPLGAFAAEGETEYTLYPIPHEITYQDGSYELKDIHVIYGNGIDEATEDRMAEVAALRGLSLTEGTAADSAKTNVYVAINGSGDAVESYITANYTVDDSLFTKTDAYFLASNNGEIVVLGENVDSCFYGLTTVYQIFGQLTENSLRNFVIEDYADVASRGFIEGYYGNPWSTEDRINLMKWGGYYKLNSYFYAPKDDPKHNAKWRELYTEEEINTLIKPLAEAGNASKCRFVYALHPYMHNPITDANYETGMDAMKEKFKQVIDAGVRQIAILADDAGNQGGEHYARMLTDMTAWIGEMQETYPDLKLLLPFCTQEYMDNGESYYRNFPENVQIVMTGGKIWGEVSNAFTSTFSSNAGRGPYLWINWPCTDNSKNHLIMGGYTTFLQPGVDPSKLEGIVLNPMQQSEPSKVAIFGNACYTWNIWETEEEANAAYDVSFACVDHNTVVPSAASDALKEMSKHMINQNMDSRVTALQESVVLKEKLNAFKAKLTSGAYTQAEIDSLIAEFTLLQEAAATYRAQGNTAIAGQIVYWLDCWDDTTTAVIAYLNALAALKSGADDAVVWDYYAAGQAAYESSKNHPLWYLDHYEYAEVGVQHIVPFMTAMDQVLAQKVATIVDPGKVVAAYITSRQDNPGTGSVANITDGNDGTSAIYKNPNEIVEGDYVGLMYNRVTDIDNIHIVLGAGKDHFDQGKLQYTLDGTTWQDIALVGMENSFAGVQGSAQVVDAAEENLPENFKAMGIRFIATVDNAADAWLEVREVAVNVSSAGGEALSATAFDGGHSLGVYSGSVANMADGNASTFVWYNGAGVVGQYVGVDLGKAVKLGKVTFTQDSGDRFNSYDLEYSTDGTNYTAYGTYSDAVLDLDLSGAAIEARYVRFKNKAATSTWTKIMEISVSEASETYVMTNSDALASLATKVASGSAELLTTGSVTMNPGEYIGFDMLRIRDLANITVTGQGELTLQVSKNNVDWVDVTAGNVTEDGRYVRLINNTDAAVTADLAAFTVTSNEVSGPSLHSSNITINASWGVAEDCRENGAAFDGDVSTKTEFADLPQKDQYIIYDLGQTRDIHKLEIYCTDSAVNYIRDAKMQVSNDLENWTDVLTIGDGVENADDANVTCINSDAGYSQATSSYPNVVSIEGEIPATPARYIRILMTAANNNRAVVFNEIEINNNEYVSVTNDPTFVTSAIEVQGYVPKNMIDGDLTTSWKPNTEEAGSMVYTFSDNLTANRINVVSNASGAKVYLYVENDGKRMWMYEGTLDKSLVTLECDNDLNLAMMIAWEAGKTPNITEIVRFSGEDDAPVTNPGVSYNVTVAKEGDGKVSFIPGTPVAPETPVTVTAEAAEGYEFAGWYVGEEKVSENASYTFEVEADITLTAKFEGNKPEATDPTEPDSTEPDGTEPEDTKPEETKPEDTKPEDTKPDASEPDASEPDASEPDASEPDASEPEYTVPECDKDDNCTLSQFEDIKVDDWYHDGIHFCVDEGIMNGMGEGKFAPNENTTRAQLVMMLYRLAGAPSVEGKTEPFSDVADTDWFYAPIVWAYENKVVNGVTATEFAPNAGVTREQVATILHRYLGEPEGTGKLEEFPDVADVSAYAVAPLTWAVGEGLITGIAQADGTALLAPTGNATRAQIATILMRHLTK